MYYMYAQNTPIGHPKLADVLGPVNDLYEDVKRKCMMRLEYESLMKCDAITSPSSKFYQKPLEYAMWKYAYYVCHKCKKVSHCCHNNNQKLATFTPLVVITVPHRICNSSHSSHA